MVFVCVCHTWPFVVDTGIQLDLLSVNLLFIGIYDVNISFFTDAPRTNISPVLWGRVFYVSSWNKK
jgi:hypothetical protein